MVASNSLNHCKLPEQAEWDREFRATHFMVHLRIFAMRSVIGTHRNSIVLFREYLTQQLFITFIAMVSWARTTVGDAVKRTNKLRVNNLRVWNAVARFVFIVFNSINVQSIRCRLSTWSIEFDWAKFNTPIKLTQSRQSFTRSSLYVLIRCILKINFVKWNSKYK